MHDMISTFAQRHPRATAGAWFAINGMTGAFIAADLYLAIGSSSFFNPVALQIIAQFSLFPGLAAGVAGLLIGGHLLAPASEEKSTIFTAVLFGSLVVLISYLLLNSMGWVTSSSFLPIQQQLIAAPIVFPFGMASTWILLALTRQNA